MTWNVKLHEISNDMKSHLTLNVMKCQMLWNVKSHEMSNDKCHEMTNVMKCQTSWNVKRHEMSNIMKCQTSWNVKSHEMSKVNCDEITKVMKIPIKNTRRYTLRSVPSSPGRSFLHLTLCCWKISFFFVECRPLLTRGGGLQTSNFGWHNMWTVPIVFAFLPSCLTQRHS